MEQYKPPGLIKKMYFKNLSFGDAPFKIENIWVEDEGEKHVLMEVSKQAQIPIAVAAHERTECLQVGSTSSYIC